MLHVRFDGLDGPVREQDVFKVSRTDMDVCADDMHVRGLQTGVLLLAEIRFVTVLGVHNHVEDIGEMDDQVR